MHKPYHLTRYTDEPREPQESADPRCWKALAVLSLAQFMLILDLTVINVALPNLGADLDLSRTAFTWAVSAYMLFFGGLMLLGGRVADVFGAPAGAGSSSSTSRSASSCWPPSGPWCHRTARTAPPSASTCWAR